MIQCLARIGEDLFLEATEQKLILQTLSQTRSAFFCFNLNKSFFEKYQVVEKDQDGSFRCKLNLKSCVAVFKSTNKVERCDASIRKAPEAEHVTFDMYCQMGVKKTYKLDLEECEPLKAVYSKDACYNRMQVQAATLTLCLNNFPANLDEISLILEKDCVRLRSFVDTQKPDEKSKLKTELMLNPNDFESYDFNSNHEVELTFCLKEIKALLLFCEKQGAQSVNFFMEEAGKPVLMSLAMSNTYEADFVIATLLAPGAESQSQTSVTSQTGQSTAGSLSSRPITTNSSLATGTGPSPSGVSMTSSIRSTPTSGTSGTSGRSTSGSSSAGKRKADSELLSPPKKQKTVDDADGDQKMGLDEDDEGPMILWTRDLPSDSEEEQ